jgi:DNA-binding NtrC family response regulator
MTERKPENTERKKSVAGPKMPKHSKGRTMVFDNEALICEILTESLEPHGFDLCSSQSGDAALKLLLQETFDVVISDMNMPGSYGLDLLNQGWLEDCNSLNGNLVRGDSNVDETASRR